jgi:hypothetical protein
MDADPGEILRLAREPPERPPHLPPRMSDRPWAKLMLGNDAPQAIDGLRIRSPRGL